MMDIHAGHPWMHAGMRRTLVACIAAVFSTSAWSTGVPAGDPTVVTDCGDSGPGTLRDALVHRAPSIDVTACTQIALVSGELVATRDAVSIIGDHTVITSSGASRILTHTGSGDLRLHGLEIADGAVTGTNVRGGCIASQGSVHIDTSIVRDCTITGVAQNGDVFAFGGGIYARGSVTLDHAIVRNNTIDHGPCHYCYTRGGGVYAGDTLSLSNSTISGNTLAGGDFYSYGGGAIARGAAYISYSTITKNSAPGCSGLLIGTELSTSTIINSTISGNTGYTGGSGVTSWDAVLRVWNSTIAFNRETFPWSPGSPIGVGLRMHRSNASLEIHSSIIAKNDRLGRPDDIGSSGPITVSGSANILGASIWQFPPDTISADPLLLPLADNGGSVWTHALQAGSPAIDRWDNGMHKTYDARGVGFARTAGPASDIGAFEVQAGDSIFKNGFD